MTMYVQIDNDEVVINEEKLEMLSFGLNLLTRQKIC